MDILITVLLSFCGGVAATCIGALGSVILCAFVALAGICGVMAGCEFNIVLNFAFGYFLSPHMGLGPAACALGYAKKRGYVEDSKGIGLPLMMLGKADVLVVGGLFAIASHYICVGLQTALPGKIDAVSSTIVIAGLVAKLLFGNEGLIGKVPEGDKRFGVNSKNNWMPHMPFGDGINYWLFSACAGCISAWLWWEINDYGIQVGSEAIQIIAQFPIFALAVIFLILLVCGLPCPVWHHIGLTSSYAAMTAFAYGANEMEVLLWGIAWGAVCHFVADFLADIFLVYGDGYVDPPSMTMMVCSIFIYIIFPAIGLYNGALMIATPVVLIVVSAVLAVIFKMKRNQQIAAQPAEPAEA